MIRHVSGHGDTGSYRTRDIQQVGFGRNSSYHGVVQVGDQNQREPAGEAVPPGDINVREAIRAAIALSDEAELDKDPFYQAAGWVTDPDMFHGIDLRAYVTPSGEADLALFETVRQIFVGAIRTVSLADVQIRFTVNQNRTPFKSLQTDGSIKEYSQMMARVIWMIRCLIRAALPQVPLDPALVTLANAFFAAPRPALLWPLLSWILSQRGLVAQPMDLISLFVRFWSCRDRGAFLDAAEIERVFAKVYNYFTTSYLKFLDDLPIEANRAEDCGSRSYPT